MQRVGRDARSFQAAGKFVKEQYACQLGAVVCFVPFEMVGALQIVGGPGLDRCMHRRRESHHARRRGGLKERLKFGAQDERCEIIHGEVQLKPIYDLDPAVNSDPCVVDEHIKTVGAISYGRSEITNIGECEKSATKVATLSFPVDARIDLAVSSNLAMSRPQASTVTPIRASASAVARLNWGIRQNIKIVYP